MKIGPLYRDVLKRLKRAAERRPHYLQDVRFILSLPLIPSDYSDAKPSAKEPVTTSRNATAAVIGPAKANAEEQLTCRLLQRPPSEGCTVDRQLLFDSCREDLRRALDPPASVSSAAYSSASSSTVTAPQTTPVQLVHLVEALRALRWIKTRLDVINGPLTTAKLADALAVGEGRLMDMDEDFIPDSFFDKLECSGVPRPVGESTIAFPAAGGTIVVEESVRIGLGSNEYSEGGVHDGWSPFPSGSGEANHSSGDETGLVSGGAVGLQREMFCHVHLDEDFPLFQQFLRGFSAADSDVLKLKSSAELNKAMRDRLPTFVRARNTEVEAFISIDPFDPEYKDHVHAARGHFSHAHQLFFLSVRLRALRRGCAVQLVNTHFFTLDLAKRTLREEAGLMPAGAVIQLLHERDMTVAERQSLREVRRGTTHGGSAAEAEENVEGDANECKERTHEASGAKGAEKGGASGDEPVMGGCVNQPCGPEPSIFFRLVIRSPDSEGTTSFKGLLYYKAGTGEELMHEPVRVLPFGQLLLGHR